MIYLEETSLKGDANDTNILEKINNNPRYEKLPKGNKIIRGSRENKFSINKTMQLLQEQ